MEPSRYMTASQVGAELEVSEDTVRRWAATGIMPAIRLPSGQIRFRRSDVDALVATYEHEMGAQPS